MTATALALVLAAAVVHATWNVLAKRARPANGVAFAAGTALIHVVYFILLQRGYRAGDLSLVYPLARGTGPLLATLVAVAAFGERPAPLAAAGIAAILAGIFLSAGTSHRERDARVSAAYGIGAGVAIAAFTLWDKHAVSALALQPILYDFSRTSLQTIVTLPLALARGGAPAVRATWRACGREAIGVAILSPLAYLLILYALVRAPVSLVAPARRDL